MEGHMQRIFGIVFVFGLVLSQSISLQSVRDIQFDDETSYLYDGIRMFADGVASAERSPLYQLWYWLQSLIISDRVVLYYFNWSALLFVSLLTLWVLFRRLQVPRVLSIVLLTAFSKLSLFELCPYVTLLGMAGVGMAMLVALSGRSWVDTLSRLSAIFGILAFVRPEFTVSFLLSFLVLAGVSWFENGAIVRKASALAISVAPFLLLLALFGNPLGGTRSFMAFGQHYSLNVVHSESLRVDPWNNWEEITKRDFGDAGSALDAWKANPKRFEWHVWTNVRNLRSVVFGMFVPTVDLLRSRLTVVAGMFAPLQLQEVLGRFVLSLIFLGSLAGLHAMYTRRAGNFWSENRPQILLLIVTVLAAAPSLISILLIFPGEQYLRAPCLGIMAFSGWGLGKLVERLGFRSSDRWKPMVLAGVFCLAALPGRSGLAPWYLRHTVSGEEPGRLTNIATIRYLQGLPLVIEHGRTLSVLEPDYGRAVYAGWDFHRISQTECRPFSECIQRKRPEVIINNDRLEGYYLARDDVGYKKFLGQPNAFGYKRMDVPKQSVQIFVRNDILRQPELH
jgi:hypothetical protein